MDIPAKLRYTKDHEWLKIEGDEATIGITDYAQGELGDIVYLDLPEVGAIITQWKSFGTIEAVKAASDLYAPASGEVIAVNGLLDDAPELINKAPYEDGWIIRIKLTNREEADTLLTAEQYHELIEQAGGH